MTRARAGSTARCGGGRWRRSLTAAGRDARRVGPAAPRGDRRADRPAPSLPVRPRPAAHGARRPPRDAVRPGPRPRAAARRAGRPHPRGGAHPPREELLHRPAARRARHRWALLADGPARARRAGARVRARRAAGGAPAREGQILATAEPPAGCGRSAWPTCGCGRSSTRSTRESCSSKAMRRV